MTTQNKITHYLPNDLKQELSKSFPLAKVEEIFFHYEVLRRALRLKDYEKCLVNGGKFVEAVLKCLHFKAFGEEIDSIAKVDTEITKLTNESKNLISEEERLIILRGLLFIYVLRNKRGGAHNSSFDPIKMDCVALVGGASWVVEELTRLYYTNDPTAAEALVENLLVKEVSLVQELDGDFLVLAPGVSARIQLEILLYRHSNQRCTDKDLAQWVKNQTPKNVQVSLRGLVQKTYVHKNEHGYILTELGIRHAEIEMQSLSAGAVNGDGKGLKKSKTVHSTKKGVTSGRKPRRTTSSTGRSRAIPDKS